MLFAGYFRRRLIKKAGKCSIFKCRGNYYTKENKCRITSLLLYSDVYIDRFFICDKRCDSNLHALKPKYDRLIPITQLCRF